VDYVSRELTVACTNVDRVRVLTDGITKGERLACSTTSPLMVPELRSRAASCAAPEGIAGSISPARRWGVRSDGF
jgi:hypothetical protein